jgi:hypothetical protein
MREKRTTIDFSKHIVTVTKHEGLLIYNFAIPGTLTNSVIFINTKGIMAVTGDFGNWIFNREFHPSKNNYVEDIYWLEKLRLSSSQNPYEFDSDTAKKQIKELLDDPDHNLTPNEQEWLQELSDAANGGEYEYIAEAMDRPSSFEVEIIPQGKITKYWVLCIFDAYDEICNRIKSNITLPT